MPQSPDDAHKTSLRDRLQEWRGSPGDLARWAFWVPFRELLNPDQPEQLARLYPLWRAQHALAGGQRQLMAEELRLCFGGASEATQAEAYRIAFRVHLEELLLGKLTRETWHNYMRFERQDHMERALARGKGVVLLNPHAGNIMMLIASISLHGYPYTQYAARGVAPDAVAAQNPEVFGHNRWRLATRQARENNEDRLPANFISLETPVRHLYRCLAKNEVVGIAYDGRIGARFTKVPYLGREALLSPGPYRLAASTGAAIVPAFCECPEGDINVLRFGEPIWGDDADTLMERFLDQAQAWLRAHPAAYGLWLAHCRQRRAVDDHPLFIDYAPDDRYKVHLKRR